MIRDTPVEPDSTTRIECENTGGYNEKPGVHVYEYCPFCGHAINDGDAHELTLSVST